ncbi:MAG: hypothetical protein ABI683_03735, partial [Ginsengibacter sp.]
MQEENKKVERLPLEAYGGSEVTGSSSPSGVRGITVLAPATIANLVCGFDVLGLALNDPCDIMKVVLSDKPGIRITHNDSFNLPLLPEENVAGVALLDMMEELDKDYGFDVTIE